MREHSGGNESVEVCVLVFCFFYMFVLVCYFCMRVCTFTACARMFKCEARIFLVWRLACGLFA